LAAWNPRKVFTQNVNGKRSKHEDDAQPETPVAVHAPPVRSWIGLTAVAAVSFKIVLVSCHLDSVAAK
jgi:hypothetical protein